MDFVPALFKRLSGDPDALLLAWLQARAIYDDPRSPRSTARLEEAARATLDYRPSEDVRNAVEPFRRELPSLLLIVTSLGLALDGELPAQPLPPLNLPEPGPLPATPVPEYPGEHALYDDIRAVYGTEHVPSMFRALAADGLLEEAWAGIGPYLSSSPGRAHVQRLRARADIEARSFAEFACFTSESARPILDQFRIALPQNLVFVMAAGS